MSSPLILGHDIMKEDLNRKIWPIIANQEMLDVNQLWYGHPGTRIDAKIVWKKVNQKDPKEKAD